MTNGVMWRKEGVDSLISNGATKRIRLSWECVDMQDSAWGVLFQEDLESDFEKDATDFAQSLTDALFLNSSEVEFEALVQEMQKKLMSMRIEKQNNHGVS